PWACRSCSSTSRSRARARRSSSPCSHRPRPTCWPPRPPATADRSSGSRRRSAASPPGSLLRAGGARSTRARRTSSRSARPRRFAEYVSLAQVPDPGAAEDADARWTPPEDDLLPLPPATEPRADDERGDGSPRAPWRWERLLVEASVIGGKERWAKRLAGLEEELRLRREALTDEEEETRGTALERQPA